jgi:phosphoglycerate dehydrogenase-like enzyme
MKLVIFPPVEEERRSKIEEAAAPMAVVMPADSQEAVREISDADAFFGKMTPQLLSAAKKLRWVQAPTASLEHYLFPELTEHPCTLTNTRGIYADVIAEHVFGVLIALCRQFPRYFRQQQSAIWAAAGGEEERSNFTGGPRTTTGIDRAHRHLTGGTLGIVGLGAIGREILRRAQAFEMRIVAVDPQIVEAVPGVEKIWPPEQLDLLLAESDFVVIAAPHTPKTAGMFRRRQFQQMRPSAYFINIGRGAIVSLADLAAALKEGRIAGAGLDVFETEPLPPDNPLWRMENVIITPHVASNSTLIAERHLAVVLDNVGRFARGEPLRNIVDKRRWY